VAASVAKPQVALRLQNWQDMTGLRGVDVRLDDDAGRLRGAHHQMNRACPKVNRPTMRSPTEDLALGAGTHPKGDEATHDTGCTLESNDAGGLPTLHGIETTQFAAARVDSLQIRNHS